MIAQVRMRGEDLRHAHLEVQPDLAEHVDRDDHGRDVQPRIADVRQDQRVAGAAQRDRPLAHRGARDGGPSPTRKLGYPRFTWRIWSALTSCKTVEVPSAQWIRDEVGDGRGVEAEGGLAGRTGEVAAAGEERLGGRPAARGDGDAGIDAGVTGALGATVSQCFPLV